MQSLTLEVFFQGPLAHRVILKRDVTIGRESAGQHSDVAKNGLERFVENVCSSIGVSIAIDQRESWATHSTSMARIEEISVGLLSARHAAQYAPCTRNFVQQQVG